MAKAKKKAAPKAKKAKKPAAKVVKKAAKKPAAKKPAAKQPAAKKKPAAKPAKPAKAKPKAKPAKAKAPATAHEPSERAKAAIAGDLAVLTKLVDGERDTYRWFAVASDFGHADADEKLAELRDEIGDDGKLGETHFELGISYLTGGDGLPVDHDKARSQLQNAKEHGFTGDASTLQRARGRLAGDALAVLDAVYDINSAEGAVDVAWGNEHTHNDPEPSVEYDAADDSHDDE